MTVTLAWPRPASTARPPLFRQHDFRLLWVGESTSALGSSVTSVALPLVALGALHVGVVAVSLLSAAAWVPWLIIGLPAGAWVDRLRRRPIMIASDIVSALLFLSVPVAVLLGLLTYLQLLAVAVLTGTAKVFFETAYRAYLPAVVQADDLVAGNSRLQGAGSAAQIAGPGLAGVMAQLLGAASALLLDAASFVVSALCLRRIRAVEPAVTAARRRLRSEIADGARFVRRDPLLRVTTVFGSVANFVLNGYTAIVVVFLVGRLGLSSGTAGVLLAVGSVGGVLGAVVAPALARMLGNARATLVTKMGAAPFGLLIPLTGAGWQLIFFAIGTFGLVAGIVAGNVVFGGFVQSYVPGTIYGRVSACIQVLNYGTIPLGALVGGALASALGFGTALWLLFAGFAASSTILLASPMRTSRDLPSTPPQPVAEVAAELSAEVS